MRPDRGIVGGRGHDGPVTTTECADTALRPRAEEVLRGLAGPDELAMECHLPGVIAPSNRRRNTHVLSNQ